jgi:hypothetical protein
LIGPSQRLERRSIGVRILAWTVALGAAMLVSLIGLVEWIAHRPSPVHAFVTASEIEAEDVRLKKMGLVLRGGSFLKEYPFQPPWTSHSLLIPSNWSEPNIKRLLSSPKVRADLLLADLDVLQPVMARAYGGWDSAAARGWNWSEWFGDWRKQLAARGNSEISLNEAFAPMDGLLAFQRDNHTQIPLNRWWTSDGSQTAILASVPAAACAEIRAGDRLFPIDANDAGQQVRTAKLWMSGATSFSNASYISFPSSYGVPQTVRCGAGWIALQPAGDRQGELSSRLRQLWTETIAHDRPRIERIGHGVVYARLPTFDSAHYEGASRESWAQREPSDRVLIVDLRDNGGGNVGYGVDALKRWVDPSRMIRFDSIGSQITASCLNAALRWGYPDSTDKGRMQELLDRMAQPYPAECPRRVDTTPSSWTYRQHRFEPKPSDMRIIALVNSRCGSDCESMTEELASLPETIVAGINTYGVCQMIQPGYSILPHTGLHYRIALGRSDPYGDNRSVDGYGLDVDLVLPDVDRLGRGSMRDLAAIVARP